MNKYFKISIVLGIPSIVFMFLFSGPLLFLLIAEYSSEVFGFPNDYRATEDWFFNSSIHGIFFNEKIFNIPLFIVSVAMFLFGYISFGKGMVIMRNERGSETKIAKVISIIWPLLLLPALFFLLWVLFVGVLWIIAWGLA